MPIGARDDHRERANIGFCCRRAMAPSSSTDMEPPPELELEAEIALLRRIAQGDRLGFEELYDRFSGILFSTAYRVLNNQEAAEDVLQDVFIQIWEKAPLYDPARGKPMTWAITLTRNKAIDRLRSTQRRSRLQDDVQRETFERFDDRDSFEAVASEETSQLVREAIHKLTADQRQAIELAFFSSLTQSQIAERLNEPLDTVKARIRRGMMKLRDLLSPKLQRAAFRSQPLKQPPDQ
ncbi:MAG: polymerase subunit sigma-70 [Chthoniobacteraceae bacterium]|nr:polymerase subunit sigma-70 [Chthoniobacteraceae bacterium]